MKNPAVQIEQTLPLEQLKQLLEQSAHSDPVSYFPLAQEQVVPSNTFPFGQEVGGAHVDESAERTKYWLHVKQTLPSTFEQRAQFETVQAGC